MNGMWRGCFDEISSIFWNFRQNSKQILQRLGLCRRNAPRLSALGLTVLVGNTRDSYYDLHDRTLAAGPSPTGGGPGVFHVGGVFAVPLANWQVGG